MKNKSLKFALLLAAYTLFLTGSFTDKAFSLSTEWDHTNHLKHTFLSPIRLNQSLFKVAKIKQQDNSTKYLQAKEINAWIDKLYRQTRTIYKPNFIRLISLGFNFGPHKTDKKDLLSQTYQLIDSQKKIFIQAQRTNQSSQSIALQIGPNDTRDPVVEMYFPQAMPKVRYPQIKGCNTSEANRIRRAWAMAHYMTWVGDQTMDWMGKHEKYREAAWNHNYQIPKRSNEWANYSPRAWFGLYTQERFDIADHAIEKLWQKRFLGKTFMVKCRTNDTNKGAHPCFRRNPGTDNNPAANHIIYGTINFCNSAFKSGGKFSDGRRVVHELMHWLRLKDGHIAGDTHIHCHALFRCVTDKMYGRENSTHLTHYDGGSHGTKSGKRRRALDHQKKALRNIDNYAYFMYHMGRLSYENFSYNSLQPFTQFPAKGFRF